MKEQINTSTNKLTYEIIGTWPKKILLNLFIIFGYILVTLVTWLAKLKQY